MDKVNKLYQMLKYLAKPRLSQGIKGATFLELDLNLRQPVRNKLCRDLTNPIDLIPELFTMVRFSSVASDLALALTAAAIPHKDVVGFKQNTPEVFLKYKPFLEVAPGCGPFPAVNVAGETR